MYKKRYWSAALIKGRAFLLNASAKKFALTLIMSYTT